MYIIPANTKRGNLIFSVFRPIDLIVFGTGMGVTILALLIFQNMLNSTAIAIACLAPAAICAMLVAPVPYYHNVLQFIVNIYTYFSERRRYFWKGWCYDVEDK